jgi:hypothetical protein
VADGRGPTRGARGIGALVVVSLIAVLVARYIVHDEAHHAALTLDAASTAPTRYQTPVGSRSVDAMSSGADFMLAVGDEGAILRHQTGEAWTTDASPTHVRLRAIAQQLDEAIAVGDDGVIVELDGGVWHLAASPTKRTLRAVVYTSYGPIAAGDGGTILRRGASERVWRVESSGTTSDLYGACAGLRDVWVVGQSGTISSGGMAAWVPQPPISPATLYAAACDDHAAIAVGAHGTILERLADVGWHVTPSGTDADLLAVSASVGTTSWLVAGASGIVLRVTGNPTREPTSIDWDLRAVTEGPLGTWIAGEKGILRRAP